MGLLRLWRAVLIVGSVAPLTAWAGYHYVRAETIPAADLVQPAELVAQLAGEPAARPLVLQVGAHVLYVRAHIAGSEYVGPGEEDEGLQALRQRVARLPKATPIVLYCGCCPWDHCRNVGGAYAELRRLGFTRVRVLYVESNFDSDWVELGYPVATGE